MDFQFSEEQASVRELARGILDKEVTVERVKKATADPDWCDRPLWRTLADAGLLGLVVPESLGGMGYGIVEACLLLQEIGRVVAPLPALPTLVLGAMAIAQFGTAAQQQQWLPAIAAGKTILSGALVDAGSADPAQPATTARREGGQWRLDGHKLYLQAANLAERVLVPASTGDGVGLFLLDPRGGGATMTRQGTSSGEPLFHLGLSGAPVGAADLLGGDAMAGGDKVSWLYQRALAAACATQLGVSEKTIAITSRYVCERIQFGVAIGSFQAVQHRLADCYIDLEAIRWTTWRAAWKLSAGQSAERELAVAKFWAADGGARIASAAQHLHGGIGVDIDYPVHRYFLWSKGLELTLGGASSHLARLGRELARSGPR
ncbi:MAG: acyl-CoA/acyl-ACP dehydrogenase [Deltaproteobacteria bacterium]|nr:acyl-CoA/acyl-ACP dehydrogenase [Deltaproteobacteria bacterium]